MSNLDKLKIEYNDIKEKYVKEHSSKLEKSLKGKLIEVDNAFNKEYEHDLDVLFPMATTLNKEEIRLENLISFVESNVKIQNDFVSDYKKLTGEVIELSYLKYSDNIKEFKIRLSNIRKILDIISDIKELHIDNTGKNEFKIKSYANKLLKKEYLNLLYEFCLIDKIDIDNIDIEKLISNEENIDNNVIDNVNDDSLLVEDIVVNNKENEEIDLVEDSVKEEKVDNQEKDNKILTSIPKIDKIGSVVPVNVFESLEKASNKLPDVVLPTNGLKDSENDIFLDTKDMFEEDKQKRKRKLFLLKNYCKKK